MVRFPLFKLPLSLLLQHLCLKIVHHQRSSCHDNNSNIFQIAMSLSTSCHLEAYEEEKNEGNHTEAATEGLPPVQAALLREQTQHYRKTHYFHKEGIVYSIIFLTK